MLITPTDRPRISKHSLQTSGRCLFLQALLVVDIGSVALEELVTDCIEGISFGADTKSRIS